MTYARIVTLAAATTALTACTFESEMNTGGLFGTEFDVSDAAFDDGSYMRQADVSGTLAGDLPQVAAFDERNGYGYGWVSEDWIDVQLHGLGDYGWAMVAVSAMVQDGDVVEDSIYVIGCSGPDEGYAEFDEPAVASIVDIERIETEDGSFYQVEIEAEFDGGHEVIGVAVVPADG